MDNNIVTTLYDLPDSERFGTEFGKFITSANQRLKELARVQGFDLAKQEEVATEFRRVVWNYVGFSQATSWRVDYLDRTGEFGFLFTGAHVCLVSVRADGSVGGHS